MKAKTLNTPLVKTTLVLFLLSCLSVHVSALDVLPGTTQYFDSPVELSIPSSGDCGAATNECHGMGDSGSSEAGSYVISFFNTTNNSRATGALKQTFTIPADSSGEEIVLDARVTGSTTWRGSLYVIDLSKAGFTLLSSLGAKAEAFIRVGLVDVTPANPSGDFEVGNDAVADFDCEAGNELGFTVPLPLVSDGVDLEVEVGVCEQESTDTFNFAAKVMTGHTYELQLAITCQTTTGLLQPTLLAGCTFNPSPISFDLTQLLGDALDDAFNAIDLTVKLEPTVEIDLTEPSFEVTLGDVNVGDALKVPVKAALSEITNSLIPKIDDGFVSWDYMTVTIDPNMVGLVRTGLSEAIRLLHTPQGKRTSGPLTGDPGYPDLCGDGDCDWPEM
jgi:hypothetical protein